MPHIVFCHAYFCVTVMCIPVYGLVLNNVWRCNKLTFSLLVTVTHLFSLSAINWVLTGSDLFIKTQWQLNGKYMFLSPCEVVPATNNCLYTALYRVQVWFELWGPFNTQASCTQMHNPPQKNYILNSWFQFFTETISSLLPNLDTFHSKKQSKRTVRKGSM